MPNPLFNRFGNNNTSNVQTQFQQLRNDPGKILDILLQRGKINYQQYNEMQSFRDNPKQIVYYLVNHGNAQEINQAQQMIK